MARAHAIAVGGYYPTPSRLLPWIASMVEAKGPWLDPCAGEGEAIDTFTKGSNQGWGIEMEKTRYAKLKEKLDTRAYLGDAFTFHGEDGRFSVLYLNPPYDTDKVAGRLEEKFLARFTPTLQVGGVLLFVVPYYALEASAETLVRNYIDLEVFRFPDPEYRTYKQVVLRGVKRPTLDFTPDTSHVLAWAKGGNLSLDMPKRIKAAGSSGYVYLSRRVVDVENLKREYAPWKIQTRKGGLEPMPNMPGKVKVEEVLKRTYPMAMPPKPAHLAMAVASGIFNGAVVQATNDLPPLLVKGAFDKEWVQVSEKRDKDGNLLSVKEEQRPKLVVTVLNTKTQEFHTLKSDTKAHDEIPDSIGEMNVADLLNAYGPSLLADMKRSCPILHDPKNDLDRFSLPALKQDLFPAQEEAVRATIKVLRQSPYAFLLGELGSGKTACSMAVGLGIGAKKTLVVCPPHLVAEWESEVAKFYPNGRAMVLTDVVALDQWAESDIPFGILSRETAKLGYGVVGVSVCPKCGTPAPKGVDTAKRRYACTRREKTPTDDFSWKVYRLIESLTSLGSRPSRIKTRDVTQGDRDNLRPFLDLVPYRVLSLLLAAINDDTGTARKLREIGAKEGYDSRDFCRTHLGLIQDDALRQEVYQEIKDPYPYGRSWTTERMTGVGEYDLGAKRTVLACVDQLSQLAKWEYSKPCGERLYQAVPEPRRVPLAKALLRKHRDCFDFLVVDECQEYSGTGSAQEKAVHRLTEVGKPTLLMTGTGMNGYASSLFSNLWACNRRFREEFHKDEEQAFVDRYGYRTRIIEEKEGKARDYGSVTDRVTSERITGNAPGVQPLLILKWILPWAVTLHKRELEVEIPELTEERVTIAPTEKMLKDSDALARRVLDQVKKDRFDEEKSGRLFGAVAQLPSYLDLCTTDTGNQSNGGYEVRYPDGGSLVAVGHSYTPSTILPKEAWMIDQVRQELAEGHHVMVWAWHKPLLPRLQRLLEAALMEPVALLDPGKVTAKKRRAWITKEVNNKGVRILVVNPMAIQTGLNNLVGFSRVIVMENPACNPIVYRQAVGRIDRIGQKKATKVMFPVYEGSLQALAHKLLFTKIAVSQSVDGLDATQALNAAGVGDIDALASMSIGRALAEMFQD